MISVIICSVNPDYLYTLTSNIAATIGVTYELLVTDNRKNTTGICKVYNEAAAKAKYHILCFLHEDIYLHTNNWGQALIDCFLDSDVGLVGISGATYKSKYPATWAACHQSFYRTNSIQHFNNSTSPIVSIVNPYKRKGDEVAVIDGVFMSTTQAVFSQNKFDEELLHGFHCYDLDYSLKIGLKFKVIVTYNILLEHFSEGSLTKEWVDSSLALHKKWRTILPKKLSKVKPSLQRRSDFISCSSFLNTLLLRTNYYKYILKYYCCLITKYLQFNKFNFSKSVFKKLVNI